MTWRQLWRRELTLLAVAGVWLLLIGLWLDRAPELLLTGALCYLAWQLWNLRRITEWLDQPKRVPRPQALGFWRALVVEIENLRERSRRRKRKLGRMLTGFRESTGALPDATVVLDKQGNIEWWNSAARHLLGLGKRQVRPLQIDRVLADPVFHAYLAGEQYDEPLQVPAPARNGVSLEVRIVPYGKGKRLLQARDITRLRQLETVRRDFVANVSHEMRTPLTVIHGYLEMMGDSDQPGLAEWQFVIDQMRQQSGRMQRIVEDLLMLSRLEISEQPDLLEPVDVPWLLQRLHQDAQGLSGGRHRFHLDVAEGLCCQGVPGELESAFSNLVFNAVRYTPEGAEITIQWRETPEGPRLSVIDTGIGIAAEHIPRLTERFYRVDVGRSRQSGGTGLGLAIVKHVMGRHGGRLAISSVPGLGSTFSCIFPAASACH